MTEVDSLRQSIDALADFSWRENGWGWHFRVYLDPAGRRVTPYASVRRQHMKNYREGGFVHVCDVPPNMPGKAVAAGVRAHIDLLADLCRGKRGAKTALKKLKITFNRRAR
jgi:hypothetical protein